MNPKTFITVSGIIFSAVAVAHALRLLGGWGVSIGGFAVPMWFSVLGLALAGYLAFAAFSLEYKS
jgi:hypothetical protein